MTRMLWLGGVALALSACDGSIVEDNAHGAPVCVDRDGDGYGFGCSRGMDCDDGDPGAHQGLVGYPDSDGDGYTAGGAVIVCVGAALPSGWRTTPNSPYCDDGDATAHVLVYGYRDADGDGYGFGCSRGIGKESEDRFPFRSQLVLMML